MQIHELNKNSNKAQIQEVFQDAWNFGKQVAANPQSLLSNPALGQAKQAARQQTAAELSKKLTDKGYTTATAKTTAQQLQTVKSNPAIQQLVTNLAAQWKQQGIAAAAKMQTPAAQQQGVKEAAVLHIEDPKNIKDPAIQKIIDAVYKQEAAKNPQAPEQKIEVDANQQFDDFGKVFQTWADAKLANLRVNVDSVKNDPWAKKEMSKLLLTISTLSLANPNSPQITSAVQEYFNVALAANQAAKKSMGTVSTSAGTGTGTEATQTAVDILEKNNILLNPTQLRQIGAAITRETGQGVIRNTGNSILNALAQAAGLQIT